MLCHLGCTTLLWPHCISLEAQSGKNPLGSHLWLLPAAGTYSFAGLWLQPVPRFGFHIHIWAQHMEIAAQGVSGLTCARTCQLQPPELFSSLLSAPPCPQGTHESLKGNAKALSTVTAIIDGTGSIGRYIWEMPSIYFPLLLWHWVGPGPLCLGLLTWLLCPGRCCAGAAAGRAHLAHGLEQCLLHADSS